MIGEIASFDYSVYYRRGGTIKAEKGGGAVRLPDKTTRKKNDVRRYNMKYSELTKEEKMLLAALHGTKAEEIKKILKDKC